MDMLAECRFAFRRGQAVSPFMFLHKISRWVVPKTSRKNAKLADTPVESFCILRLSGNVFINVSRFKPSPANGTQHQPFPGGRNRITETSNAL